jgi:AraC family transcriptional regulator
MDIEDCDKLQVLHIKNMVCTRCIKVVRNELEAIGLKVLDIELGRTTVCVPEEVTEEKVQDVLEQNGFKLLHDSQAELVEQIKLTVIDLIYQDKLSSLKTTLSSYLATELGRNYAILSATFKALEEITLNHFIVLQKIERAKELLGYNEQNVSEIADRLGYRSVQHLSAQFKAITGVTPLHYRHQGVPARKPINEIKD